MKAKPAENDVNTELVGNHFQHKHRWKLKWNNESEMWLECKCGRQMEVPEEDLEASYEQIKNHDTAKS